MSRDYTRQTQYTPSPSLAGSPYIPQVHSRPYPPTYSPNNARQQNRYGRGAGVEINGRVMQWQGEDDDERKPLTAGWVQRH